jgi:hypothetical protein
MGAAYAVIVGMSASCIGSTCVLLTALRSEAPRTANARDEDLE